MKKYLRLSCAVLCTALSFAACRKVGADHDLQPVIKILSVSEIGSGAASGYIEYSIENPVDGKSVSARCAEDWLSGLEEAGEGMISFSVSANDGDDSRTAVVVLSYPGAEDVTADVFQPGRQAADPDADIVLEVSNVTSFTADVKAVPADDEMTYLLLTRTRQEFDDAGSDEAVVGMDLEVFAGYAESQGVSLELFLEAVMLRSGVTEGVMDTFLPDSEYCIYAYGIDKSGKVTTGIYKEYIKTEPVAQYDDRISITAETIRSRSIDAVFTPDSEDFRYYAGYLSSEEYDEYGDQVVDRTLEELEFILQVNNALGNKMTWDDVTAKGEGLLPVTSLYADTKYSFFAFGIDHGYRNTSLFKEDFRTSAVDITDDCTFDVSYSDLNTFGATVNITPSSMQTRYFMTYLESASAAGLSDDQLADACMSAAEEAGINWATGNLVHTGSYSEVFTDLVPATEYSVVVFGVNPDGERTTEVSHTRFTTSEVQPSDMTLSVSVGQATYNSADITVRSSSSDEEYVITVLSAEDFESYGSNLNAIRDEICSNPNMYCTEIHKGSLSMTVGSVWDYGYIEAGRSYVVVAFGATYWYPTTDAVGTAFSTPERDVSDAYVDIRLTVYDGNDLVEADPAAYPASQWQDRAAIQIDFVPNSSTASWYGWLEARASDYMQGLNYDVLLQAIRTFGQLFDNPNPGRALVSAPWNYKNYSAISLGLDADKKEGEPEIVSLCVDRSQIVPFNARTSAGLRKVTPVDSFRGADITASGHGDVRMASEKSPVRHVLPQHIVDAVKNGGRAKAAVRPLDEIVKDNIRRTAETAGLVCPY